MDGIKLFKKFFLSVFLVLVSFYCGYGQYLPDSLPPPPAGSWISNGSAEVGGIGISRYTKFNEDLSWDRAMQKAVTDLNANTQIMVRSYGYQNGRGPMRMRQQFAINTFYDTTSVVTTDSLLWNGWAMVRVKPLNPVSDSILNNFRNFKKISDAEIEEDNSFNKTSGGWITSTGVYDRLESDMHASLTKAKQDALRKLAEQTSIRINVEHYSTKNRAHRDYSYTSTIAFQRVRILDRTFEPDTVKVKIGVRPQHVVPLLDD